MEMPRVTVGSQQPLVIAPPLRGGDWLAANGPSNTSVHRRALLVVNGTPHIAQRFAIDWIKIGPGGRIAHDDRSRNENWFGYGEEVLAVADGTVVATKDGIPENVPMTDKRAVPITLDSYYVDGSPESGPYVFVEVRGPDRVGFLGSLLERLRGNAPASC